MMLVPSLMALAIAAVAVCLSVNTKEEMVKVAAVGTAGLCLLISLVFAPWMVKLAIVALPLVSEKFHW